MIATSRRILKLTWNAIIFILVAKSSASQSCGPRVSARLLAEIPCDMSKSSYCSAPGSAYPWNSVKRYINDNQGLVRRMYGDEKHSSVLLNEIDGFRIKFDMLRHAYEGFNSRTVYGRSVKSGRSNKPTRRQPRPQIFADDLETVEINSSDPSEPATIFRVVTETSIKVGGPSVTQSMKTTTKQETTTVSYEPAVEFETATTKSIDELSSTTTETMNETTATSTTEAMPHTETIPFEMSTTESSATATTTLAEELPSAMERIGYEDFEEEYELDPKRKSDPTLMQNSVEEKIRYKENFGPELKMTDSSRLSGGEKIDEDIAAEASVEEEVEEEYATTDAQEKEEVPRRGINACPVKNEVIAPYWANNTRGETLALLNVHPFEQYVHFEKCAFENHQMLCRDGCRCEQQYRLHRLLAFDPKNECRGIFSDWFRFPSCCVCICYDLTPDIPRTRRRKGRM